MAVAKANRNKELVFKRLSDPARWSFGELGDFFNMHKTTAKEIYDRDLPKYQAEFYLVFKDLSNRRELSTA